MNAERDVVVENQWTSWRRLLEGRRVDPGAAQSALLTAGGTIKSRLGLRAEPFRFRGSGAGIELQVFGVAGTLSLDEVSLQIVPKFVGDTNRLEEWDSTTLFLLEALAGKHVISLLAARQQWRSHSVLDLIAYAFADSAERALLDQPIHAYRQREESSVVLRGRLNIGRQVRNLVRAPHLLECDVDQLDTENAFNDVLKWAASVLAHAARDGDLKRRLQSLAQTLPGNVELSASQRYTRLIPPPQFQGWVDALELARLLANGMTLSKRGGVGSGYSLLFNMERAFERFVEVALDHVVRQCPKELTARRQAWATYGLPDFVGGKLLRCRPDNVLCRAENPVMVVDAKYKLLDDELAPSSGELPNSAPVSQDVYELLGGMAAHGCDTGLLVYPSASSVIPYVRTWLIDVYGRRVRVGALAVDLLTLRSRAEMAKLFGTVAEKIAAYESTVSA